ncbi:MAG: 5'-methylthioadenosine/adenosylhomocysteine nucleosidase [Atopobiaceae bacterium]|jgi:adenosylhomocysteine nucleosidase
MKIGIIGAMQVEVDHLVSQLNNASLERCARMEFHAGHLGDADVVVVRSGVGKVDAAVCAEILIERFGCTHVVNTGIAGSLNNQLNIGDVLVSSDVCHHDVDATNFGYAPGQVPGLPAATFDADPRLRAAALRAAAEVAPEIVAMEGRVASGDQFVRDADTKVRIVKLFSADCCEMEGASIAQTCWLNETPFVVVRAISDKADGSAHEDYPTFEAAAARHCSQIVERMVELLVSDPSCGR